MTAPPLPHAPRRLVIEPGRADARYWRDLWEFRELFGILAWRDVAVRYKQTAIGIAWAVIRPLLTMVVFTVVFGRVAGLPSDGDVPYPVMVFAGMLGWFLFATILSESSGSLVTNAPLIGKVYFPRLVIPAAAAVVALVDFLIGLALLAPMMLVFGVLPDARVLLLPLFVVLAVLAALGPALWLGSLNVRYRDVRYVIPFLVQFGLYLSPVGFSSSVIPEEWRLLYALNPMVGVIDGMRWSLLGGQSPLDLAGLAIGSLVSLGLLALGLRAFRRTERGFADVI